MSKVKTAINRHQPRLGRYVVKGKRQPPGPPLSGGQKVGRVDTSTGRREGGETKITARVQQKRRVDSSPDKGRQGGVRRSGGVGCSEAVEGVKVAFLPYNKNLTALARENRKNPTEAESKMWNEVLCMRKFSKFKFLRQKPLAGYIVDFYCSELRLVIEIDGDSHVDTIEYDAERTRMLNALGLTVVRYTNDEVLRNIEGVFENLISRVWGDTE